MPYFMEEVSVCIIVHAYDAGIGCMTWKNSLIHVHKICSLFLLSMLAISSFKTCIHFSHMMAVSCYI